ncbi:hypothetical protein F2P81_022014 [Scophthalmus maximus]|uniref:Uncharacterized protein n=1 Tax=Scophthalmus maximus TaxID=52904 RepID=A0A6A4RSZ8_SCOMX|nr:hypothetical protein F2P81_022014 [Scophthalmus maximus]
MLSLSTESNVANGGLQRRAGKSGAQLEEEKGRRMRRDVRETISTNQPYHPLVEQNRDAHEHRFAHKVRRVNSAEENPTETHVWLARPPLLPVHTEAVPEPRCAPPRGAPPLCAALSCPVPRCRLLARCQVIFITVKTVSFQSQPSQEHMNTLYTHTKENRDRNEVHGKGLWGEDVGSNGPKSLVLKSKRRVSVASKVIRF